MRWLSIAIVLALSACAAHARLPPESMDYSLGTDSKGRSWTATANPSGATLVSGSTRYPIALKPPLSYLGIPLRTILPGDRAVLVDHTGRGAIVTLATGASQPITLPSQSNGVSSPLAKAGHIWYADGARLMRYDPASDKAEPRFTGEPGLRIQTLSSGGDILWMSGTRSENGKPGTICHVLAFDIKTSRIVTDLKERAPQETYTYEVKAESDTVAWVVSDGRIQRVETGGAAAAWSFSPRSVAATLFVDGRLAVIACRYTDENVPTGWLKTIDVVLGLIDPKKGQIEALALTGDFGWARPDLSRVDADRLDAAGRIVRIVDGHLVLEKK